MRISLIEFEFLTQPNSSLIELRLRILFQKLQLLNYKILNSSILIFPKIIRDSNSIRQKAERLK